MGVTIYKELDLNRRDGKKKITQVITVDTYREALEKIKELENKNKNPRVRYFTDFYIFRSSGGSMAGGGGVETSRQIVSDYLYGLKDLDIIDIMQSNFGIDIEINENNEIVYEGKVVSDEWFNDFKNDFIEHLTDDEIESIYSEYSEGGLAKRIKKWLGHEFKSSMTTTPEWAQFARDYKKILKEIMGPDYEIINWYRGHFYISTFFRNKKTGKLVYVSTSVMGYEEGDAWYNRILIRNAKHENDYVGGRNHWATLDDIKTIADELTRADLEHGGTLSHYKSETTVSDNGKDWIISVQYNKDYDSTIIKVIDDKGYHWSIERVPYNVVCKLHSVLDKFVKESFTKGGFIEKEFFNMLNKDFSFEDLLR